ncbi:uncharacterized protein LOC121629368 isoform X1 [Melanotaenia boesemani]|uniref:uncharacterized protein LOC121628419 isoform X1 n=1 Tax=Melanotaenia boesemani TaxID=1250792 RepID=UPI001C059294|nr:uncharacterized protein LOC121628419 isoform X1 [Melanotaenia boesemani]XP_041825025.1 uncharacterized protein LOC121629368 isoform X1 [Melanotaenia boesemani]
MAVSWETNSNMQSQQTVDMTDSSRVSAALLTLADQIERENLSGDAVLTRLDDIFEILGMVIAIQDANIDDNIFDSLREIEHRVHIEYAQEELSLSAGRPRLEIPRETLGTLVLSGITIRSIAEMFAVSPSTVRRRMVEEGLRKSDRYSSVGDAELDAIVLDIQHCHPNAGWRMMLGHLRSRRIHIQRSRLVESMRRVNPEGVMMRRLSIQTARRRQYSVPAPNYLWHIDGNHKLIRWRFVVHGGIDGFSRLIVYLNAATNNKATTVFDGFLSAVRQYGIPSRVRSDKGGENVKVAHFMVQTMGENRNSHITGRSVHNQRIERLWRDVYENVLDLFYTMFTQLEIQGLLNPGEEIDLFALHRCFLHHIQHHLQAFKEAWNQHGLRTENNCSPLQLWSLYRKEGHDFSQVPDDYGIDWTGPHSHHPSTEITIPEIQLPRLFSQQELAELPHTNVPLSQALQVYIQTVHALKHLFHSNF